MQTVGYWCDKCRRKYVQHRCDGGLPCGHSFAEAVKVYAKSYGKGGETVQMSWFKADVPLDETAVEPSHTIELWIEYKPDGGSGHGTVGI